MIVLVRVYTSNQQFQGTILFMVGLTSRERVRKRFRHGIKEHLGGVGGILNISLGVQRTSNE